MRTHWPGSASRQSEPSWTARPDGNWRAPVPDEAKAFYGEARVFAPDIGLRRARERVEKAGEFSGAPGRDHGTFPRQSRSCDRCK